MLPARRFAQILPRLSSAFAPGTALRGHAWLSLSFILSRVLVYRAGLRIYFSLEWMWIADPSDLQQRFWHTLLYFHAMPPGMNTLAAVCLKLGGTHAASVALVMLAAFGLVLANALYDLGRGLQLSPRVAFCLPLLFSLSPPALFFDHLFMYESPVVCLLCCSAALFLRAVRSPSFWRWFAFFLAAACVGLIRSTFHLLWFAVLVGLSLRFCAREKLRTLLLAAAGPALLLSALYLKNLAIFGFFAAFSEGPVSLDLVTIRQLPPDVRDAWIAEGKLSPYAAIGLFEGPRAYLPFFKSAENPAFPPELSLLEKPTSGAPNYNHWFYLEVMPVRARDARVYLRERPWQYLSTVERGVRDFFSASTRWHPNEGNGHPTPHDQHRTVLGGYENLYNRILHGFPFAPVGWYLFLPVPLGWAVLRARELGRAVDEKSHALAACLWFMLFQVGYVVAASTLFTFQESSRYRYQIEPFIWLITAASLTHFWRSRRPRAS